MIPTNISDNMGHNYYDNERPSVIFYDVVEEAYRPVQEEVAFYLRMAQTITTPLLEIGCGTGRVSWPLAEAGHKVLGVDIAPAMVERAERKRACYAEEIARRVQFIPGDACSLNLGKTFELILAPYRVFNHLTTLAAQESLLTTMRRHVAAGGQVIFDTTEPIHERLCTSHDTEPLVIDLPHLGMTLERKLIAVDVDILNQAFAMDFCYTVKTVAGDTYAHVDRLVQRCPSPSEIRQMLERTGFHLLFEFKDFKYSPPEGVGDRIWVAEAI